MGYGWYALEFDIPQDWSSRDVKFLIGTVDEQAWVYLNGKKIGEHSVKSEGVGIGVLWKEPFIVRVPASDVKPGEKNLLLVKTHASTGESGIWKAVKYRPVDASTK